MLLFGVEACLGCCGDLEGVKAFVWLFYFGVGSGGLVLGIDGVVLPNESSIKVSFTILICCMLYTAVNCLKLRLFVGVLSTYCHDFL